MFIIIFIITKWDNQCSKGWIFNLKECFVHECLWSFHLEETSVRTNCSCYFRQPPGGEGSGDRTSPTESFLNPRQHYENASAIQQMMLGPWGRYHSGKCDFEWRQWRMRCRPSATTPAVRWCYPTFDVWRTWPSLQVQHLSYAFDKMNFVHSVI